MMRHIIAISFLLKGSDQRHRIESTPVGKFQIPNIIAHPAGFDTKYKLLTAYDVIAHHQIKKGDPVLTLSNGEKFRVFVSGDSKYLPAEIEGIIRTHDFYFSRKGDVSAPHSLIETGNQAAHSFTPDEWYLDYGDDDDYS